VSRWCQNSTKPRFAATATPKHNSKHRLPDDNEPRDRDAEQHDLNGEPWRQLQRNTRPRRHEQGPDHGGNERRDDAKHDAHLQPDVRERCEKTKLEQEPQPEIGRFHAGE
jgi:hypothetical protein